MLVDDYLIYKIVGLFPKTPGQMMKEILPSLKKNSGNNQSHGGRRRFFSLNIKLFIKKTL
jgi:hypothetical protein